MDLNHQFTVAVPVEDAWRILTDVERIAPCLLYTSDAADEMD
jgi:carbon monoxide dehydrogenase subunit G